MQTDPIMTEVDRRGYGVQEINKEVQISTETIKDTKLLCGKRILSRKSEEI